MLALLVLVFYGVALAQRYLHIYAPSNRLCRRVRSSPPRWRAAVALIALAGALLFAMRSGAEAVASGAPGWVNLVVLIVAWDTIKFFASGLLVVVRCAGCVCKALMSSHDACPRGGEAGT